MRFSVRLICAIVLATAAAQAAEAPDYTTDNRMKVPTDYRQWVFLTSSLDLDYSSAVTPGPRAMHMLDNVFVNPEAFKVFSLTGTWPDKTIMVKENRNAESAGTLSKSGRFQTDVMSIEIHVKDAARFPGQWAFFELDGKAPGELLPQSASCYSCHQAHAAVDTTFVQFYPTLIGIARDKGTFSPGYLSDQKAGLK